MKDRFLETIGLKEKKKEFVSGIDLIKKIALGLVERANSGSDPDISEKLAYYAGLPKDSRYFFELAGSGVDGESVDIFTIVDGQKKTAFILSHGETTVFFENKDAVKDQMISKFKKYEEIKDFDTLEKTIREFIFLDPKEGEVIDISKEALEEKREKYNETSSEIASFKDIGFYRKGKKS